MIDDNGQSSLAAALETAPPDLLGRLSALGGPLMTVLMTGERAGVLGLNGFNGHPVAIRLAGAIDVSTIDGLARAPVAQARAILTDAAAKTVDAPPSAESVLDLLKAAQLVPAAVISPVDPTQTEAIDAWLREGSILRISTTDIETHRRRLALSLVKASEASVPLQDCPDARFHVFRAGDGGPDHCAIVVGDLDQGEPPLVRLHSACLTGDVFGSLRCDCGEQLRDAVRTMAQAGSGVLLYLAQEGRGIGLANKMRAYTLQDSGLDTVDADRILGFAADERRYEAAVAILRQLGVTRIRPMTNNPEKLAWLTDAGFEVVERVPLRGTVNPHNRRYLSAKAERCGHLP